MWLCHVVDIDIFHGPAFLLAADMPQNVALPRFGYRYPCWPLGGHVGPMLGHVVPVLNLCWAKNGVFLEAIWGLSWAYVGGKRMVCWAHVGSRYAAMLGVVVNCQETHTHSIRPEHGGMFHSQFCFAAMLLHVRYLTAFKHGWNMFGLHSTLYTPRFTLSTPQSAFHTLDSILHAPHSTLYTPSFPSLHCALYTPHSTFHTPRCTLYTLHSNSTLHTLQSTYYRFWRCTVVSEDLPCIGACALASAPWSPKGPNPQPDRVNLVVSSNMSCTNCFHSLHQNGKRGLKPNRGSTNFILYIMPLQSILVADDVSHFHMSLRAKGFWLSAFGGHSCIRLKREVLCTCKLCHWLLHWVSIYSCVFVVLHHSSSKLEVLQRHHEQTGCGLLGLWTGGWRPAILCVWRRLWTTGYEMLWIETSGTNTWGMNVHLLKFTYQLFFSPEYDGFDS